jgi:hypothetical protein
MRTLVQRHDHRFLLDLHLRRDIEQVAEYRLGLGMAVFAADLRGQQSVSSSAPTGAARGQAGRASGLKVLVLPGKGANPETFGPFPGSCPPFPFKRALDNLNDLRDK